MMIDLPTDKKEDYRKLPGWDGRIVIHIPTACRWIVNACMIGVLFLYAYCSGYIRGRADLVHYPGERAWFENSRAPYVQKLLRLRVQ